MSTARMDDNQGTARMDTGTDRMDAGTARMGADKGGAATAVGVVFASGQTVVLNGKNCVIESMISIGSGEAIVYKANIDGRPYALKHYKPKTPLSDTAKKVIAKIKDNSRDRIVKIYDFGSYNGQDFEVMEYAEGGTLDQYIKSNGAIHDTNRIKNIVKMITEGLEQLHGYYKVIYQDLKPENIYFRDAGKTSIVLSDFGISSVMEGNNEEVEVTASITDLYAAPELAHKGNRNEVIVTPAVDYFALGITMLELWLGGKPFKGVKATRRDYMIAEEKVDFPADMPDDYMVIIRGLIRPQRKDRWGNGHVRKWLNGETLVLDSNAAKAGTVYDPLKFSDTEAAASPKELAGLMDKYPDLGKTCLYDGMIQTWLQKASNLMLFNEIQNIISRYADDRDAGLYTATLALDTERPFKSRGGKICKTTEDIADAIMAESAYYMEDLKRPNANLYLYLAATEGSQGKEAADIFCKYFQEYSPKRALALVYFKLQDDGGITIGAKHYRSPNELKAEDDGGQTALVKKAVTEKDSMLLVWLSDIYGDNLQSTDTFSNLSIPEQFFLLGLLPFLSFKEFNNNSWDALRSLIDTCPGRADLFEIYIAQGLPLTGQNYGDKRTPIDYVVCNFNYLSGKHGIDTVYNLIRLLCKLGADVNEHSGDGTYPLINAYDAKNEELVKLLLGLGADADQWRKAIEQRAEEERRIREEKRKERERIFEQQAKYTGCVAAKPGHTVGLKADGTVVAVGSNDYSQCNVNSWRDIVAVAVSYHTVGLKADGTVVATGNNEKGQCNVSEWRDIVAVAVSLYHTVGLKADSTVVAVGDNKYGQCNVSEWHDIVAVAVNNYHTVGLKADGTVVAVGNMIGQYNVSNWRDIVLIATGDNYIVGLKADSTVVAVGANFLDECNVSDWRDIVAVAGSRHTVGLKADGTVVAVGDNKCGQCSVSGWRDIVAVAVNEDHTVGLKADGTVVAVGDNKCGQCNVSEWRDIVAVAVSLYHTVGLKADGTVVAVGTNSSGQCNVGNWRNIGPVPKEKRIEWKSQEQSKRWQQQGLCKYCGGKLGGLFTKKCKACGKEQ